MGIDRRAFLRRSATVGFVLAADEVLNASEESPTDASRYRLANDKLRLVFDSRGLLLMEDTVLGRTFNFKADRFRLEIDKKPIESAALRAVAVKAEPSRLTYTFRTRSYDIDVVYELRAGWRFVSKQVLVSGLQEGSFSVEAAEPLQFELEDRLSELYVLNCRYPKLIASGAAGLLYPIPETDPGIEDTGTKAYVAFLRMEEMRGLIHASPESFLRVRPGGPSIFVALRAGDGVANRLGSIPLRPRLPWSVPVERPQDSEGSSAGVAACDQRAGRPGRGGGGCRHGMRARLLNDSPAEIRQNALRLV